MTKGLPKTTTFSSKKNLIKTPYLFRKVQKSTKNRPKITDQAHSQYLLKKNSPSTNSIKTRKKLKKVSKIVKKRQKHEKSTKIDPSDPKSTKSTTSPLKTSKIDQKWTQNQ